METPLNRIETVQRKYSELLAEMKRTEREHIKAKKRAEQLQKEKDASRVDLIRMTTTKEKMEKLCRELQKEAKKLKDENRHLTETESRQREDLRDRLEGMVLDVQAFIDHKENPESIPANIESDELFRHKFKSFIDQYEMRELQFHSLLRTKELEVQYQMARYEQQRKAQEHEATKSRQLTTQVSTFSQTETELRNQLNIYVEKFKQVCANLQPLVDHYIDPNLQVEDTLNNSNDLFLTFRREMEEMSKKTKRLEKENHNLTRKHDLTNHNILQMAEERTKTAKDLEAMRRKNDNLERLCRGMQDQGRSQPAKNGVNGNSNDVNHRANGTSLPGSTSYHTQVEPGQEEDEDEDEGTESEYEDDDDDEEEVDGDETDYDNFDDQDEYDAHMDTIPDSVGPHFPTNDPYDDPYATPQTTAAPSQTRVNGVSS